MAHELIKNFEGIKLTSYKDIAGVWTVGFGSTMYTDGKRVGPGETITLKVAEDILAWECLNKRKTIDNLLKVELNCNQFESILSFVYNLGIGAFAGSTLLKKINADPEDPCIKDEFMRWNKARVDGVLTPVKGLTDRRLKEAQLYFS